MPEYTADSTAMMKFDTDNEVEVRFYKQGLMLNTTDGTSYQWRMDIGYIDSKYANTNYIYNHKVNMLGLAPINT